MNKKPNNPLHLQVGDFVGCKDGSVGVILYGVHRGYPYCELWGNSGLHGFKNVSLNKLWSIPKWLFLEHPYYKGNALPLHEVAQKVIY